MLEKLKRRFENTWLHPRYINFAYMIPLMERIRPHIRGVLLDVGCGQKPYEMYLKEHVAKYIGIDWPAKKGSTKADILGDALALPFKSSSIDTIIATELMEHLPYPNRFLAEASRVLNSHGSLIISVPFMEPLHEEPRDFYRFTPHSLGRILLDYGFRVIELWPKGGWWSVVLASFTNQALYNWANPINSQGFRQYRHGCNLFVIPICSMMQRIGYALDHLRKEQSYSLGYVTIAKPKMKETDN